MRRQKRSANAHAGATALQADPSETSANDILCTVGAYSKPRLREIGVGPCDRPDDRTRVSMQRIRTACKSAQLDLPPTQYYRPTVMGMSHMVRIELQDGQGFEDCAYLDLRVMTMHWPDGEQDPLARELERLDFCAVEVSR